MAASLEHGQPAKRSDAPYKVAIHAASIGKSWFPHHHRSPWYSAPNIEASEDAWIFQGIERVGDAAYVQHVGAAAVRVCSNRLTTNLAQGSSQHRRQQVRALPGVPSHGFLRKAMASPAESWEVLWVVYRKTLILLMFWRKGWDSNPRYGITVHRISSLAFAATLGNNLLLFNDLNMCMPCTERILRTIFGKISHTSAASRASLATYATQRPNPLKALSEPVASACFGRPTVAGLASAPRPKRSFGVLAREVASDWVRSLRFEPSNGSVRRMPSLECSLQHSSDLPGGAVASTRTCCAQRHGALRSS